MKISLKDLYLFNELTSSVNSGKFYVKTLNGLKKIEGVDITAKNSIKLKIKTENFQLTTSPEHLLYKNDWVKSNSLKLNDEIDTINGYEKIIQIEKDNIPEDLYDIQVENEEYIANGIRSHNSSLLESIDFALFNIVRGKNIKRVPHYILPNRTNKNLETEIDFINWNGDNVVINRKLNPKNFTIKINGVDKTDKYDLMQQSEKDDIIGIEYNTYKSLVSLNLADFANFINLETETKKKLLNRLFNINEIDDYYSITKEVLKNAYKKKIDFENSIINNEKTIIKYKDNLINLNNNSNINKIDIKNDVIKHKKDYIDLDKKLKILNEQIENLNSIIKTKQTALNDKKNKINENNFIINELNDKIEIFKSGHCPLCNTALTDNSHNKELNDLLLRNAEKQDINITLNTEIDDIKTELLSISNNKRKVLLKIKELESVFNDVKNELKILKIKYDTKVENSIINELDDSIKTLNDENSINNSEIKIINEKIQKFENLLNFFSEKGIKKNIIKTAISPINEYISNYLIQLESKYNVKLDDNFDAIIKERYMDDIHVESLSTGEARKINIAIALSYMEVIINMNKKTNILFLDEVFASVDSENIDLILKVLKDFSERNKINVIIVNHTKFDNTKFDRVLFVEKINGYTSLSGN